MKSLPSRASFPGLAPSGENPGTRRARHRFRSSLPLAALYCGLTAALWGLLVLSGDPPVTALMGAMSALSTSGITAEGGFSAPAGGLAGEVFVCAFLLLALSRVPVSAVRWGFEHADTIKDRETKLAFALPVCHRRSHAVVSVSAAGRSANLEPIV